MQGERGRRPYDVAAHALIDRDPASWLALAGLPVDGPARAIETDVSTVLAEVDAVLEVDGPTPWLAHLELQSGRDQELPLRLLQYQVLLRRKHGRPVATVVVLLRARADGRELTGELVCPGPAGEATIIFRYEVIRIWQRPVEEILGGGLVTLPLAPLAAVEPSQLPAVAREIDARIEREASPDVARDLRAATYLLMGLRYDVEEIRRLMSENASMRESVTYQLILEEGREEGREVGRQEGREVGRQEGREVGRQEGQAEGLRAGRVEAVREVLLRLGTHRFGPPPPDIRDILARLDDLEMLDRLIDRLLTSTSWGDLLFPEHD